MGSHEIQVVHFWLEYYISVSYLFLKHFLLIFREREGQEEGNMIQEGDIYLLSPACPPHGTVPVTRACIIMGNQTATFLCTD